LSFKAYLGIKDSILPKLATGFGGGIGRKGSLCGAFTGSIMSIGMRMGRTDSNDKDGAVKVYSKCQEFWSEAPRPQGGACGARSGQFEKEFGSNLCYNIIEVHLDNEEERQKWLASQGLEKCSKSVEKTAQMLCEYMKKM
jgi:C_GCAxxG_C_C family probable redox protein